MGGRLNAVVTSPPFENSLQQTNKAQGRGKYSGTDLSISMNRVKNDYCDYGQTKGNIGNEVAETYWSAMMQVYSSCFKSIQSGGVIAVVIKDYVKAGKRMRLCDDTLTLLEHVGFVPLERIRAMLVNRTSENGLFGDDIVKTKTRKSFFKRLHESRLPADSECRIDWEEVLILRKP